MSKEIDRKEIRFAFHLPSNHNRDDTHYVKEQIYYKDGTSKPNTFITENFERPVWVTTKGKQNYRDKKEFSPQSDLNKATCTQSDLNRTTARLLDKPYLANRRDELKDSPFVYGYDITSSSLIKYTSLKKNNFISSPYTIAAFDLETSTDENDRDILMGSVVMKSDKGYILRFAVWEKYLEGIQDMEAKLDIAMKTYLPNHYDKIELITTRHKSQVDLVKALFKTANEWAPDFLSIWNMSFDIEVILNTLEKANIRLTDVLCDQSLPDHLRYCRYKKGPTKKVTESGVVKPINPSLQWHTLYTTSKFWVIDAMCTYRQLRMHLPEQPRYSLDHILNITLGHGKLNFDKASHIRENTKRWHDFMQSQYPIEYMVYNFYDVIGMLELDDVTGDLTSSLGSYAGITDFDQFASSGAKARDDLFLFGLTEDLVIGTSPPFKNGDDVTTDNIPDSEYEEDEDDSYENPDDFDVLSLRNWIQLLPQNLLINNRESGGLKIFSDFPEMRTNARGLTVDADKVSAYPSVTSSCNVSKETTNGELISVDGVREEVFRQQNLGVCLGTVNTLEYFEVMFNLPPIDKLLDVIDAL